MAQRRLGLLARIAAGACPLDFGIEDVEDVRAERDDGRREALLLGDGRELACRLADEKAGLAGGVKLLERGVDADRLEVEQFDAEHLGDVGVDVAGQPEVDDQLARGVDSGCGGGVSGLASGVRARRVERRDRGRAAGEQGAPAAEQGRVEHVVLDGRAGEDEVGPGGFLREGELGHRVDAV